jgi:hypothetical protein
MTKEHEAMKQALEALEHSHAKEPMWKTPIKNAIASLRQAIAEAEKQEPAMRIDWWPSADTERYVVNMIEWNRLPVGTLLYTHPQPKREWVGLTLDEIDLLEELYAPPVHPDFVNDASHCLELIRHVEAKLKEKNK